MHTRFVGSFRDDGGFPALPEKAFVAFPALQRQQGKSFTRLQHMQNGICLVAVEIHRHQTWKIS
ncbi:hypothetical protein D3C75_1082740 [compost metagenome]